PSKHRGGGVSEGKSARKGSGEVKVARATEGEREEREEGKERKKRGRGTVEGGGKVEEDIDESIVKPTRPIKLSKSDDLRVLIARKKGERSAPPTYLSGRRYSHSGSEGEEGEEEEEEFERGRGREGGRRGGLSSVVKIPERTHLSIEGGSRLLARAIKGLAAPPLKQFRRHDHSRERGRRGGREEREREGRGRRELAGTRDRKQKTRETHVEVVSRVKRAVVEEEEEIREIGEEIEGRGEMEEEGGGGEANVKEDDAILPLKVEGEPSEKIEERAVSDETTRKVELAVITALRKVLPGQKELTDLRQLINQQRESKTSTDTHSATKKQQETHFVVTMDGLDEGYNVEREGEEREGEEEEEQKEERGSSQKTQGAVEAGEAPVRGGGSGMPERCRFWPNCKKADSCPFHHPSAKCRYRYIFTYTSIRTLIGLKKVF
ncbi:Zinc finger CCCH domain-containing protein 14, partial [Geodia barretti]